MKSISITVKSELGFHVRPASVFVNKAKEFKSDIKIKKGEVEIDGTKLMKILFLEIEKDDNIELTVDGIDEDIAVEELAKIICSI